MKLMEKQLTIFLILATIFASTSNAGKQKSDQTITFFIKNKLTKKVDPNIKLPAIYGGYIAHTNNHGQIIFPKTSESSSFYILITKAINPVFSVLNNISHWKLPKNNHAKMYKITKNNDPAWLVEKNEIPKDNTIPLQTIVILANPDHVSLNIGNTPTLNNEQLLLPPIFANQKANSLSSSFKLPNIKPFWAKIKTAYELMPYGYATIPVT